MKARNRFVAAAAIAALGGFALTAAPDVNVAAIVAGQVMVGSATGELSPVTQDPAPESFPVWPKDGQRVAYLEQGADPDKPVITWTEEELGRGTFYHDRKLNERFLSVFT